MATKKNEAIEKKPNGPHPSVQVKHWLSQRSDTLAEWCTESIDPVTLIRVGTRLVAQEPKFQDPRTWPSLYMALITAAQLGLEPEGPRGEAYLIPYWDKNLGCECVQLMPGYRGLMRLVTNSPIVKSIRSQVVHENDEFSMDLMDPDSPSSNYHRVKVGTERGPAVGVYSRVTYTDGTHDCEYANWNEVEKARSSAKGKSPAWDKWPEQMARKFIIKRHSNQLPLEEPAALAVAIDNIASDDAAADARAIIDADHQIVDAPEKPKLESGLAGKLAAKSAARKKAATGKSAKQAAEEAKAEAAKERAAKARAAKAAKKKAAEQAEEEEAVEKAAEEFKLCELCGVPSDDDLCAECTEAGE